MYNGNQPPIYAPPVAPQSYEQNPYAYNDPYQQQPPQYPNQNIYVPPQQAGYPNQQYNEPPPAYNQQVPDYNYNTNKINYQVLSVEQWNDIPNDPSPYSQYWQDNSSFEPDKFADNKVVEKKWNDLCFFFFFWINFVVYVALFIYLMYNFEGNLKKFMDNNPFNTTVTPQPIYGSKLKSDILNVDTWNYDFTYEILYKAIGWGFLAAVILNFLHGLFLTVAPGGYIKFGFVVGIIFLVICALIPALFGLWFLFVFPAIFAVLTLIVYCCIKDRIPLSAAVLKYSMKILWKNPSLFFVIILEAIIDAVCGLMFVLLAISVVIAQWSYLVYIYFLLSYFWVTLTFGYVVYMTVAGVGATWYFLNDTEYYPKHPVWESFKRAATTSFGSASIAGFLMAVVKTLRAIVSTSSGNNQGPLAILACIALCLLSILECIVQWINRYALIYCAVFGVPFGEGCRRFAELEVKKFAGVLINSCIVDTALTFNMFIFLFSSGLLGFGFTYITIPDSFLLKIFLPVAAVVFFICIFVIIEMPASTLSDTLFICFIEKPENLKTTASELYEQIRHNYSKKLKDKVFGKKDDD